MKIKLFYALSAFLALTLFSCQKETREITGNLGGETIIPLTEVGNLTYVYLNGSSTPADMTVESNVDGTVIYKITYDLTGRADSAMLVALIPDKFKDEQNRLILRVLLRITSEGYQDADKPFILVKYDSNVGDVYAWTDGNGKKLTRRVSEKSATDDWPFGFMYIKTITVEQTVFHDEMDDLVNRLTFKANHRFGMVYVEAQLKNGTLLKMDLYPTFPL